MVDIVQKCTKLTFVIQINPIKVKNKMNCPFDGRELIVHITGNGGCYTKCECGWVGPVMAIPKDVERWCDRRMHEHEQMPAKKTRRRNVKKRVTNRETQEVVVVD